MAGELGSPGELLAGGVEAGEAARPGARARGATTQKVNGNPFLRKVGTSTGNWLT